MIGEAVAYNERLVDKPDRYKMTEAEEKEYRSILDLTGKGVMGYIQINSIGVNLPVYHGVEEKVLQVAIGHIEGTSLPVGGPTTHAAVSGHRGLPSAKLFTDLDKLVEGDTFTITILNRTTTYEVDQIRIVDPTDMSDLNLQQGADYVTLVTCTPYGINTHRLLVRGHRIDNIEGRVVIPAEALQIPNYIAVPAVAIPMLFAYLVGSLIYYRFFGGTPDRERVMAALEDMRVQAYDASEEDTNHE
jgi:sortase A